MTNIVIFSLIVGIGSTLTLDIWVMLVKWITGIPPTDWGLVARWVLDFRKGHFILDGTRTSPANLQEQVFGWIVHYSVGITYAVLILIVWGAEYIAAPTILPIVIIGFILSTIAGMFILFPGLGAGIMASKLPNQLTMVVYLIVAHAVFAVGQYGFALWTKSLI